MLDVSSEATLVARAQEVVSREAAAVAALSAQMAEAGLAEVLSLLLACEGHVLVTGAGTSHAMAQRLAHLLSCSGTPALCISAADALHGGSGAIRPADIVYAISKGGRSEGGKRFRGHRAVAGREDRGADGGPGVAAGAAERRRLPRVGRGSGRSLRYGGDGQLAGERRGG